MRICFFTENYYKGGLDTFLINLVNAWPNSDDELILVCNNSHPGLITISEKVNRPITIIKYKRLFSSAIANGRGMLKLSRNFFVRSFFILTFRLLQYPILFPWYLITLMFFFLRNDFDRLMVVNGGYPASLLCRCSSIAWWIIGKKPKAVFNFHNSTSQPHWLQLIFENLIDRLVIQSASHIVSVSKSCLDTLFSRKSFVSCDKLSHVYNGIEDPKLHLNYSTKENNKPRKYCLMLATYELRKGHKYLLRAFRHVANEIPNAQLMICGHGQPHEKKKVADIVRQLNLEENVTLNDFYPNPTELISNASMLLVPSQSHESFGLTIIEAMALSVPVVVTDVGGMPEVLGDSFAGYLCPKDAPKEFATSIIKILVNTTLANEMGRNGRATFERKYLATTMANSYQKLLT